VASALTEGNYVASKISVPDLIPDFIFEETPNCASVDPELFFPQESEPYPGKIISKYIDIAAAKRVCSDCPLKLQCLEYGLKNAEIGIWGGLTESQRESLRKANKIRLTRKHATPITW
jgi:WhiB family redox-sensing transcriptional regulator